MTATIETEDVKTKPSPKRTEWQGPPPQEPKHRPLIPPGLCRGMIEMGGDLEKQAADHGLYWIRVHHRSSAGEPRPIVGPYGKLLEFDTEHQLPGGAALQLVSQGSATFLFDEPSTKAEMEFVERARKLGYVVEAPRVNVINRPEFAHLKNKKKSWMSDTLDPSLGESRIG